MILEQVSVFVENKPGKLVEALEVLSSADIDMRALSLADTSDFGILRVIVDDPRVAFDELSKAGFLVKLNEVIPVEVNDEPGGFAAIMRVLSGANISVEYTYAFVAHERGKAFVILRVDDNDAAKRVLKENGVKLLSSEEIG